MRRHLVVLVALAALFGPSWGPAVSVLEPVSAGSDVQEVFELVNTTQLEEPPADPANLIVGVTALTRAPDGRFAVVDRKGARVRIYSPRTGDLLASLGRFGSGPGEFRSPIDAAFDRRGRLYVVDVDVPRLTRFDAQLAFDTTFSVPGYFASGVKVLGQDSLLLTIVQERRERLAVMSMNGHIRDLLHRINPATLEVPYWSSILKVSAVAGTHRIYLAENLLYPIHQYSLSGGEPQQFGVPPESWIEASRPDYGQFVGQRVEEINEWLRSFTVVDAVGLYQDSLLLVVHGRYGKDRFTINHYSVDIYDRAHRKIYGDVPVPGQFLYADEYVYFLLDEPPAPWTIGAFRIQAPS